MVKPAPDIVICFIILGTVGIIYVVTQLFKFAFESPSELSTKEALSHLNDNWLFRLSLNILGYATIFVPGYIIYQYVKKSKYLERSGSSVLSGVIKLCFANVETEKVTECGSQLPQQKSTLHEGAILMFCFLGLQGTYLTWGVLQEKVMTQEYVDSDNNKGHFTDSQFLVFVNRILAFGLSGIYILCKRQPRRTAPLYKYVYCSFSNIMSSWCQYEALKFISFPTQVLAKASKIIPVMIMGKFVSRKKFEYYEYVTAVFISLGMIFFMLGSAEDRPGGNVTTFSGLILLAAYILFDSFTSNWQDALFIKYQMNPIQMMCGVNLFSCLFTAVSLAQQGSFIHSLNFMTQYYKFVFDCLLLSVCSAAGQLLIFYTISNFGSVVFVIIMTVRQGLAILLSCLIYQHNISILGKIGIIIVFISVFLRIYCNHRLKSINRRRNILNNASKV